MVEIECSRLSNICCVDIQYRVYHLVIDDKSLTTCCTSVSLTCVLAAAAAAHRAQCGFFHRVELFIWMAGGSVHCIGAVYV